MTENQFEQARMLEERLRQASIEEALAKARFMRSLQGTTKCVDCGDDIPEARRKAVPSAFRCVACQTILENEKHGR